MPSERDIARTDAAMDDALAQALRAIRDRDRLIAQMRAEREAAGVEPDQPELSLARWPLADYAMGDGAGIALPATLEDIAEVIGRERAVRLAEALRPVGTDGQPQATGARPWRRSIYVPRRMKPDHPLVRILGWDAANRLQRSHTNMIIEIPWCADLDRAYRQSVIRRLHADGVTPTEIAQWVQMHPRSIQTVLAADPGRDDTPEETATSPRHPARGEAR